MAPEQTATSEVQRLQQEVGGPLADVHSVQACLHQKIGQIQMGQTVSKLLDGMTVVELRIIKENKLYRMLDGEDENMTWPEFCQAIGFSQGAVDEKIRVLDRLGAEFFQLQQAMGLGRDQVRLLLTAPSEVQAEATELAQAAARGDVAQAVLDERFHELVDRIEKLEAAAAGRTRLIEEREAAQTEAEEARATAKAEEARRKKAEKAVKLASQRADELQKELDTPPRLRDPDQARAHLGSLIGRAEALACEVEGAAAVVAHYLDEQHPEAVEVLAKESQDITSTVVARLVNAYGKLIGACQPLGQYEEHATMLAMLLDGEGAIEVAQKAVEIIRAEAGGEERERDG